MASRGPVSRAGAFRRLAVVTCAALALAAQEARAAEPLRWKVRGGETIRYTIVQQTTQIGKAGPNESRMTVTQMVDLHCQVKKVAGETAELTQAIDRLRMKIQGGPASEIELDSAAEKVPEGPVAAMLLPRLKAMVQEEFTFRMTRRGEISDIKVPPKLVEALSQGAPPGASGMFSEDAMKNLIGQWSLLLPEPPVEAGATWSGPATRTPFPMVGTFVLRKTYSDEGADPSDARARRIGLVTKVSVEPAAEANLEIKIVAQEGKGEYLFSVPKGRVIKSKITDKIVMTFSALGQSAEQTTETMTAITLNPAEGSR